MTMPAPPRIVAVRRGLLRRNDEVAADNRRRFAELGIAAVNLASSPGAGKTALLERTLHDLGHEIGFAVAVGDLATDNDARRLQATGTQAEQIVTGTVCHLDATMVQSSLGRFELSGVELLLLENVGNLVCPASYDLGETARVILLSTTEGEDKPLKYPTIFNTADLVVITKHDLAEAVGFDRAAALANVERVRPGVPVLELSARSGVGLEGWYAFLRGVRDAH